MLRNCVGLAVMTSLLVMLGAGLVGCGKQPIAQVGEHKITRAEFLEKLEEDQGRNALLGMISKLLLEDAFAEAGLSTDPKEVEKRISEIKGQFESPEAFARTLSSRGMTEQDLLESVEMDLKVQGLCTKDVEVTDANLTGFFEQYKDKFGQPEQINYSEIVVSTEDEAKQVAEALKKPDADFAKLAKQHSISPMTRERGGQVPPLAREQIYPAQIKDVVIALKPGTVSDPIDVDGRFYLVKLDKIVPAREADFKTDRAKIEEQYKLQNAKNPQQVLTELREKASVKIIDPKYADLQEMFAPKADLPSFGESGPQSGPATPPAGQPAGGAQAPPAGAE